MKIYEIPTQMRAALESVQVDEDTGEILNPGAIDDVTEEASAKIANCARYIREVEAKIEAMKQARDSINARMKSEQKRLEWLKGMTLRAVLSVGKVEEPDIRVSTRKSAKVQVNEELLHGDWYVEKIERKPNLHALSDALKQGVEIEGAELVTNFSLAIK